MLYLSTPVLRLKTRACWDYTSEYGSLFIGREWVERRWHVEPCWKIQLHLYKERQHRDCVKSIVTSEGIDGDVMYTAFERLVKSGTYWIECEIVDGDQKVDEKKDRFWWLDDTE